jgi:hypothetical protein
VSTAPGGETGAADGADGAGGDTGVPRVGSALRNPLGTVAALAAVGVFVWQLPHFLSGNGSVWPQFANAFVLVPFHHLWTLAVLLVVTAVTRTIRLRTLVVAWLVGVFAIHWTLILLGTPFVDAFGTDVVGILVAPVNQTVVVALVVAGFFVLAARRGVHPSVSDGLLVGFAVGAGVAFHEDMTYRRIASVGPGAEYGHAGAASGGTIWWSWLFPAIGWFAFVNIRQYGRGDVGVFSLYHAGWGALLGLGVGFAYVYRHDVRAWLAAAGAMAVSVTEHMSVNYRLTQDSDAPIVGWLFTRGDLFGVSELAVYLLLAAIVAGVAVDAVTLRRTARAYDAFPSGLALLWTRRSGDTGATTGDSVAASESRPGRDSESRSPSGLGGVPTPTRPVGVPATIRRLLATRAYVLSRRGVLLALARDERSGRRSPGLEASLWRLARQGTRAAPASVPGTETAAAAAADAAERDERRRE